MMGFEGSSGLLKCSQSASLKLHPRYVTSSTKVRSFEDTLNVVTAGSFSESEEECSGRAVPGPARSEAKLVDET
jgi:hypothetical protein